MSQKSYNNTPSLYLVPTPIGNMEDMTFRAINVLKNVSLVLSEDTRVTSLLFKHFNITNKLVSNHKYNEEGNKEKVLMYLKEGKSIALVSDRGMPLISDPGNIIVDAVIDAGFNVISLPGASAFTCALISSGLNTSTFTFIGFLNTKTGKRKKELEELKNKKETLIFYEAPHRISDSMKDILDVLGNRKCSISREISKKFEEIYRGNVIDVIEEINNIKGEIVIIVSGNDEKIDYTEISIIEHINLYITSGSTIKEAIKEVAKLRSLNKNEVYMQYHGGDFK